MPRIHELVDSIRVTIPANDAACGDGHARIRHESFILRNFFIGTLILALVPVYLAMDTGSNLVGIVALGLLSLLAPVALFLSKTGRLLSAHALQTGIIGAFVTWVMVSAGEAMSPVLLWLLVLPFEAVITGSRRLVLANIGVSVLIFSCIGFAQGSAVVEPAVFLDAKGHVLTAIFLFALVLYGVLLVLALEGLNRETLRVVRDREFLHQVIGENVIDAVSLHDQTGSMLFVTPSMNDILDTGRDDSLGDSLFSRVHVADRPAYLKALSDTIGDKKPTTVEFRARAGQSCEGASATDYPEFVWLEMRCKPLVPEAGRPDRVVAVTRDVTERKHREDELRLAREKAEEAFELKTRFLANVSHELRTPLNAILGFSDLLKSEVYGPIANEKYSEYIQLIHDSGTHLLTVVNDILDMSKIEAGKFQVIAEPFDAAFVIKECVAMTMPQARDAGVNVIVEVPGQIENLTADRRAVRQIVLNLLSNAIKFTEPGGSVTISMKKTRFLFIISVSDTGIGVSADDIKSLGKPFFQVDNTYSREKEGTGLGLSVVKGLTELHGGEVRVESEVGVGTTIAVEFPVSADVAPVPLVPRLPDADGCEEIRIDDARKLTA